MNPESDYRKRECKAKILTLDGQEIATGTAMLGVPGVVGMFLPDHPSSILKLDTLAGKIVAVQIDSHRHEVLGWHHCKCQTRLGYESGMFGDHYHFQCED